MTGEIGRRRRWFQGLGGAAAALLVVGIVTTAASGLAQEPGRDRREYGAPDRHDARPAERRDHVSRGRRERRPAYGYDAPTYVPDPPPVVYAPPQPPPGLSLMFNFR